MDFLFISTADWDNPYWTNKQHVAKELGRLGHRLLYVESQGLRRPTATGKDFKRILRRLLKGLKPPKEVTKGVWVWSPIVIPFQSSKIVRVLNKAILRCGVYLASKWISLRPEILWTYSPMTTEFYNVDAYKQIVYHAVDDIKAQPGMPAQTIEMAESKLSRCADIIFTTAPRLQELHSAVNPNTFYFSNVADFDHFHMAMADETKVPEDLERLPAPRIGFVGAISSYKLDFDLIAEMAKQNPSWSIVMIGEIGEGDPLTNVADLRDLPNLHFMGGRSYATLPAYLKGMDVAILPSLLNEYTRSMFPMKFFEYLAAGLPVVATCLPALKGYEQVAALCPDTKAFVAAVSKALQEGRFANLGDRLAAAREQTYETRTRKMLAVMAGHPYKRVTDESCLSRGFEK